MALAFTTTLLPDHKGNTRPKAVGDEYVVDALIDVTSHVAAGATINASDLGLSSIHCVTICGTEGANAHVPSILTSATGTYTSTSSFKLMFTALDGTNATVANDGDPACAVRVRAWGLI